MNRVQLQRATAAEDEKWNAPSSAVAPALVLLIWYKNLARAKSHFAAQQRLLTLDGPLCEIFSTSAVAPRRKYQDSTVIESSPRAQTKSWGQIKIFGAEAQRPPHSHSCLKWKYRSVPGEMARGHLLLYVRVFHSQRQTTSSWYRKWRESFARRLARFNLAKREPHTDPPGASWATRRTGLVGRLPNSSRQWTTQN